MMIAELGAAAAISRAGRLASVPSWDESRIWRLGGMTIPAPEPCPDASQPAGDPAAAIELTGEDGVVVRLPGPRDERPAFPDAGAVSSASGRPGGAGAVRRLRLAAPVQLELVLSRQGPGPEVVWASLPEHSREAVLVVLARLIGAGAIDEPTEEPRG